MKKPKPKHNTNIMVGLTIDYDSLFFESESIFR